MTEIKFFCGLALKKIQYNMKNAASGRVGCYLQDDMEAKKTMTAIFIRHAGIKHRKNSLKPFIMMEILNGNAMTLS